MQTAGVRRPGYPPGVSPGTIDLSCLFREGSMTQQDRQKRISVQMRNRRLGALSTAAAFIMWGLLPAFWKLLNQVDPFEVLAHRIVWTCLFAWLIVLASRRGRETLGYLGSTRAILSFTAAACLLSLNWYTFIYAVAREHVMECSLGYYINPLVNVLLGMVLLKEKCRPAQIGAIILAAAGVCYLTVDFGQIPWIALALAFSFSLYGMIRKTARYDSLPGLVLETSVMAVPALIYLGSLGIAPWQDSARPLTGTLLLLAATGIVTLSPLLTFAWGARRINYTSVGLIQFLTPTGMLILGALVYKEPFTNTHGITLGCIWIALVLYSMDALRASRQSTRPSD